MLPLLGERERVRENRSKENLIHSRNFDSILHFAFSKKRITTGRRSVCRKVSRKKRKTSMTTLFLQIILNMK